VLIIVAAILGVVQHLQVYSFYGNVEANKWYFWGAVGIIGLIGIVLAA